MTDINKTIPDTSSNASIDEKVASVLETYFDLPAGEGAIVAQDLEIIYRDGGQPLFRQADESDAMYLLVRGRLQVWVDLETPVFIGEVLPGESVGEVGLITGEARSAGVLAVRYSVLVKLDKNDFERLALEHPAMLMQLMTIVAKRLHENTTGKKNKTRPPPSILCLRPFDDGEQLELLGGQITKALEAHGDVLYLSMKELAESGLPYAPKQESDELSDSFYDWFSELEENYRFIVLACSPSDSNWSAFAESQSDLILLLANSSSDPALRDFERREPTTQNHIKHEVLVLWHPTRNISASQQWLEHRHVEYHLHIRGDNHKDLARVGRVLSGNANGLVLGGGAARGFAHLGIYQAICEADIPIDWIGGTSIGAIMGVAIALYEDPDTAQHQVREAFVVGKPFGDYTLPLVSVLSGNRMNKLSRKFMPGNIEDLAIPFFATSSDLSTGELNVHESGPIWRATGASAALPGVLPPMVYKNTLAVDGAVLNNLPVDIMATKPVGKIFAAVLSSKDEHEVAFEDIPSPWQMLVSRFLPFSRSHEIPKSPWQILVSRLMPFKRSHEIPGLATLLFKATEVANRKRTNDLASSADLLFHPPVQHFSLLKVDHFDEVVEAGYAHGAEIIENHITPQDDVK